MGRDYFGVLHAHEPGATRDERHPAGQIEQIAHALVCPPSTTIHAPLTKAARSDARNATAAPISSGDPKRPKGTSAAIIALTPAASASNLRCQVLPGKRMFPGATVFTRTPCRPTRRARSLA